MRQDPSAHATKKKSQSKPLLGNFFCLFTQFAVFVAIVLILFYELSNQTHYQFFANDEYPLSESVPNNFTHPLETLKTKSISYQSHNKDLALQLFDEGIFNEFYLKFKKTKHSMIIMHSNNIKENNSKKTRKNKKSHKIEADLENNVDIAENNHLLLIFLRYFALSQGYYMVQREYKTDFIGGIYSTARAVRNFFQKKLKLENEPKGDKIMYVLHLDSQSVPEQEIQSLFKNQENNKVVIISNRNTKIKRVKNLGYFPEVDLKTQLSNALNTKPQIIDIYLSYYGFTGIFDHLRIDAIEAEKHLGSNYVPLPKQSSKNKEIRAMLSLLCQNGHQKIFSQSKIKRNKGKLSKLGVLSYNSTLYWVDDIYRLNYMLQMGTKCISTPIDHLPQSKQLRAWSIKEKILIRNQQKLVREEQEQLKKLEEERINKKVQQLHEKLKEQERQNSQEKKCECKCSIDIEKECKIIFEELKRAEKLEKKKDKEKKQNEGGIIEQSSKKRVRIGLKGFEKFVMGEKVLTDGDMSLEEIEEAIKHPKGKIKEAINQALNQGQQVAMSNLQQQEKASEDVSDQNQIQKNEKEEEEEEEENIQMQQGNIQKQKNSDDLDQVPRTENADRVDLSEGKLILEHKIEETESDDKKETEDQNDERMSKQETQEDGSEKTLNEEKDIIVGQEDIDPIVRKVGEEKETQNQEQFVNNQRNTVEILTPEPKQQIIIEENKQAQSSQKEIQGKSSEADQNPPSEPQNNEEITPHQHSVTSKQPISSSLADPQQISQFLE